MEAEAEAEALAIKGEARPFSSPLRTGLKIIICS
jgi:hypothetical protein